MTANVRYVAYARTQRGLRSCALADGPWRKLKWLAVSDPALDIVQTSFSTHLVEGPNVVRGLG